jgi:hypothetical protein
LGLLFFVFGKRAKDAVMRLSAGRGGGWICGSFRHKYGGFYRKRNQATNFAVKICAAASC